MAGLLINTIATFLLGVSLVVLLRRLAFTIQLVDRPDAVRKRHTGAIPLCGGVAVFMAFAIASFAAGQAAVLGINFWLGLLVIVLIGIVDDRRPLPAAGRFVMQLAMAFAFVGGANIGSLSVGTLLSQNSHLFLPLFFVVGVVFVTGLVNSWNMMDGIDGLAGGVAGVALIWLMLVASFAEMKGIIPPLQTLMICLCAFLVFNMRSPWRSRASIFLGDAGSTALGATISYAIILLATESVAVTFPALLWIVVVPVADTLSLIVRRLAAHRSPMSADRWHLHHLLLDQGFTPVAATSTIMIVSGICGGIGYLGIRMNMPGEIMAIGLSIPIGLHTLFVLGATGQLSNVRLFRAAPNLRKSGVVALAAIPRAAGLAPAPSSALKDE